jgi:hypothetical protein
MHRYLKTPESAKNILRHIIANHPLPLRIQFEFVDQHLELADAGAGKVLYQDQAKLLEQHRQEMEKMRHEIETANETTKKVLLEEIRDRDAKMKKTQDNMDALKHGWETEKVALQQRIRIKELESNRNNVPQPLLLFLDAFLSVMTRNLISFP